MLDRDAAAPDGDLRLTRRNLLRSSRAAAGRGPGRASQVFAIVLPSFFGRHGDRAGGDPRSTRGGRCWRGGGTPTGGLGLSVTGKDFRCLPALVDGSKLSPPAQVGRGGLKQGQATRSAPRCSTTTAEDVWVMVPAIIGLHDPSIFGFRTIITSIDGGAGAGKRESARSRSSP